MIKLYDLIEKKSQAEPKYQTTVVSSPLRGQNQDQTGYGVKNDVADYTISDSVGTTDYAKGSKNRPVNPDISIGAPQTNRTKNAPSSSSASQSSATARAAKEMKMQINRDKSQVDIARKEISLRKHSEKMRDQEAEKIKNKPIGAQTEAYVRSDVNTTNTHGHDDPSDSAAARITGVAAKQPAPKKPIKTPLPPKDPKAKQKANPAMTKSTIPESKIYMTFADFIKVSEGNIAEATRASIAKAAAVKSAREAGVKINEPKKPAKENPIKLRAESYESEAYLGNHEGLRKYAHAHGGIDADDMLKAAHHMEHGNVEGLKHHLHGMDTDPRDFVLQHIHKGHWNKLGFGSMKEENVNEAKKHDDDETDVKAGSGKFAVDLRKRPVGDYHTLTFADGKTHKVHTRHVAKANKMMANAPRPSDKEDIQNSLHHSHDRFMQTVNTGKAIKDPKRSISLGGSSKIGGSKE